MASQNTDIASQFETWASSGGSGLGHYLLEHVFGSQLLSHWGVSGSGVDGGPVAAAMNIVVWVALVLMPLIVVYIMAVGTVHTAEHGEWGGKQWTGKWSILRSVFGAITVVPVTAGGLSSIQLLVIGVALVGNYFGNQAALAITKASYSHGKSLIAPASVKKASPDAVAKGFSGLVGMSTCQQIAEEKGYEPQEIARMCQKAHVDAPGSTSAVTGLPGDDTGFCEPACADGSSFGDGLSVARTVDPVGPAIQRVNDDYAARIGEHLNERGTISDEQMAKFQREYERAIQDAINKNVPGERNSETAAKSIDKLGWPGMGLWFVRLANSQAQFNDYIVRASGKFNLRDIPAQSDPGYDVLVSSQRAMVTAEKKWSNLWGIGSGFNELVKGGARKLIGGAEQWTFKQLTEGNPPMEQMMDMGHWAIGAAAFFGTSGKFFEGVGEKTKTINPAGGIMEGIGSLAGTAAAGLFVLGLFMSQVLPALPGLYVGYMSIEWVIWVAIACISSPLWTLLHLAPEGEGLIHHGAERGWKMLGFLMLFPVFVMVGYAVGIMIFNVAVPMMAQIVWGLVPDGAISAVLDILGKPLLVGATMAIVGYVTLGLIHRMPYQIADWLGIGTSSLGFSEGAGGHESRPGPTIIPQITPRGRERPAGREPSGGGQKGMKK